MRIFISLALLLGAWQAQAFAPAIRPGRKNYPVATNMAVEGLDLDALSQMDPAVLAGIAAGVLGVGGIAAGATQKGATQKGATQKDTTTTTAAGAGGSVLDVSIPYDAAARLAYDEMVAAAAAAEGETTTTTMMMTFESFKPKYEQLTVARIKAKSMKQQLFPQEKMVDLSIPYDAAARMAYDEWRSDYGKGEFDATAYQEFKKKYEDMSVAEVTAKKLQREMP